MKAIDRACSEGNPFRLLLIDAHMPETDGFALIKQIRSRSKCDSAIIVMLTSSDQPGEAARCRSLGVDSYLIKPIQQDELLEAIRISLAKRSQLAPLSTPTAPLPPSPAPVRSRRVLLVEDQPINQRLTVRMLEKRGHSVVVANNGLEALEMLAREPFDVVLMDVQMPEMDGFEATRAIRRKEIGTRRHLPIVAMTAFAMKGDRERCLQAGCDAYLAKPIDFRSLCEAVESTVATKEGDPRARPLPASTGVMPWDRTAALAKVDGDEPFLIEMVRLFQASLPEWLQELEASAQRQDATGVVAAAHTVKGNAAALGATPVQEQAALIESKGRKEVFDGIRDDIAELARRAEVLNRSFNSLGQNADEERTCSAIAQEALG
jgi:CheY-like chemotaxis protein/HPt (histidine-containing phosphotransfer) domain-containing protein